MKRSPLRRVSKKRATEGGEGGMYGSTFKSRPIHTSPEPVAVVPVKATSVTKPKFATPTKTTSPTADTSIEPNEATSPIWSATHQGWPPAYGTPVPGKVRRLLHRRSGGVCERCRTARAVELHHRKMRSAGGTHHPLNCLMLCTLCHTYAHTAGQAAYTEGLLLHFWDAEPR